MERKEVACGAWFQKINYIGAKTMFLLKEQFGSMKAAYEAPEELLRACMNARQFSAFQMEKQKANPEKYLSCMEKQGIRYVSFFEDIYPEKLKNIPDPPYGIFVKGSLPDEGKPSVAIIGARACSEYGRIVAEIFSSELVAYDVQIISGMARGIDSISQKACVKAGGQTFAVLGNGVDICYPEEMYELYKDIPIRGGLISTYAPGSPPVSGNFPPRNRIISGLADMVLVVEARQKSGTLITVDMALEQGKEVGIIPGRITDSLSQGCHQLIKQGANMIVDVEQLLEILKDTFLLQNSFGKNPDIGHKANHFGIDIINRQDVSENHKKILEILMENPAEYMEPEQIYKKLKEKGYTESFHTLMENFMDLELLDLCKSNKNKFSIR